jgi:hypothetical protein
MTGTPSLSFRLLAASLIVSFAGCVCAPATRSRMSTELRAQIQDVFVLVTTDKIADSEAFYSKHFGFAPAFESTIYVQMSAPAEAHKAFSIAFMPPVERHRN